MPESSWVVIGLRSFVMNRSEWSTEKRRITPLISRETNVSLSLGRVTTQRSACEIASGLVSRAFSSKRAHASTCERFSMRTITSAR